MTNNRDLIDQLDLYSAKMRQERDPIWRAAVEAERMRIRADAARMAIADMEEARWRFSQVLTPFLPEPSESQPVALQSDPAPQFNGHQTGFDHEAEFFGHEPASEWADILRRAG